KSQTYKLCFAIGGAPKEVAASATAFFLQIYLLDIAQINAFQASMVLFIGKAWGAVTDPVVGFFITKSRWTKIGRLMPWMVGCTPFLVVSYFYLWFVPPFISGRFIWYLGFYCLYQTLITCFHVPYSALTMFLSTDQRERDSATAYRMTMEVLGTLVGAAIQGQIVASAHTLKHCPPHNMTAGYLGNSSVRLLQCRGSSRIASERIHRLSLIACYSILSHARVLIPRVSVSDPYAPRTEKQIPFYQGFILVMRHGPYLTLTAAFLFITVAIQLIQSNFVLFCTYAADLRDHFQNIVLTILLSAVISIPLWQWFLQRFGKKTAAFCGITWIMPFTMMLVFIPNVVVAYVVAVSSGLSVAASLLLPWSMLPDVVDDFRLANPYSKGHEAIFYSFYVFFTKFAAGISLGVSTLCLEFAGYDTGACKQPAPVVYTLKLLIGAAPVAFIVTGLMILLLYPISEDVRLRNKIETTLKPA
uniref:MFSD2 lysolipid transporter B, sphingolipid n=1 Tax=Sparus aurata TaxID=8175 RepID=A0A671UIP7_SPAAU